MPAFFLKENHVGALNVFLLIVLAVSAALTIILILMHSGKGTGVSDMIASSMYNSAAGSGIWEKNLDRLTVITAIVFGVTICILALTFPVGTIG
ncbi:preprotein translocase subunit SecG [Olsenella umbonata]|jgi:preprotein translocase subunit SecG|uniref:Protein-export membrane protein SecG n=1 Tax=Parafannyhessea umbonata TaxID=604330 RepID=A0A6N7X7Q1_9ACTN|nr:preprotein translocase subunit SecG [Parafannyhessea umbonata]